MLLLGACTIYSELPRFPTLTNCLLYNLHLNISAKYLSNSYSPSFQNSQIFQNSLAVTVLSCFLPSNFFPKNHSMAPKIVRHACESGKEIINMRCRINDFHCPRAGLNTSIFFEKGEVHSLGLAWTSRVPIVVENNMPTTNWFTPNPYSAEAGILGSKWYTHQRCFPLMKDEAWSQWVDKLEPIWKKKWTSNGIYELIMLSKVTVIAKPEFLTIFLIFWNTGTNTFDFQMGPMFSTILDMIQVFRLRPLGICVGRDPRLVISFLPDC